MGQVLRRRDDGDILGAALGGLADLDQLHPVRLAGQGLQIGFPLGVVDQAVVGPDFMAKGLLRRGDARGRFRDRRRLLRQRRLIGQDAGAAQSQGGETQGPGQGAQMAVTRGLASRRGGRGRSDHGVPVISGGFNPDTCPAAALIPHDALLRSEVHGQDVNAGEPRLGLSARMSGDFSECQGFGGWQTESLNFVSSRRFSAFHFSYFSK
ncbi:hypothetical protein D3C71_734960 [compost metagenome]